MKFKSIKPISFIRTLKKLKAQIFPTPLLWCVVAGDQLGVAVTSPNAQYYRSVVGGTLGSDCAPARTPAVPTIHHPPATSKYSPAARFY